MENKNQNHSVGKTIKLLREKRGLTQVQLAEKINVSDKAVSKWEKDGCNPDFDSLCTLANFFDVTLDYLMIGKKPQVETVTISKLELCAKTDSEKLFYELKKEKKLSVADENRKTLLDYVLEYESKEVFELICKNLSLNAFMCPKLVKMLLKSNFPVMSYGNMLSDGEMKRCELAGLDENWFIKLKDDCFNNEVLDLVLYNQKISQKVKSAYMEICTPYRPVLFERTIKKATQQKDDILLIELSTILKEYNSNRRERYKLTKEILNKMLDKGLFNSARKFDEGFNSLNEKDYRLAELRFNNATKDIIRENEFILNGLLCVNDLLETKDLPLIKRCIKKYNIHYLEYILDFYKSKNYKDLFALSMYLELNEIVNAIIADSAEKIEKAIETLIFSYHIIGTVSLGDEYSSNRWKTGLQGALTINWSWFGDMESEFDYDDAVYSYSYKNTRFAGVEKLKNLNEKIQFIEKKICEAKAEIISKAEEDNK